MVPPGPMPSRAVERQACRVRLASGPAAAAKARSQVRAAIAAWNAPADADVAVLLTSELVTNAVKHTMGQAITLGIRCTRDRLRVDVHDRSPDPPVLTDSPADAETGRGLMLVASLSAAWGSYRTPRARSSISRSRSSRIGPGPRHDL
jgi:anti-sigma regulatory factor (Ser/Thr protein kinase)